MGIKIKDILLLYKFIEFAENSDWVGIPEEERTITKKDITRAYEILCILALSEE